MPACCALWARCAHRILHTVLSAWNMAWKASPARPCGFGIDTPAAHHCQRHHSVLACLVFAPKRAFLVADVVLLQVGPSFHLHCVRANCFWTVLARVQQLDWHCHQHRSGSSGGGSGCAGSAGSTGTLSTAQVGEGAAAAAMWQAQ